MLHKCYIRRMQRAGLRELRQQASELVRRVEDGETIVVTVSGRAVAHLAPIPPARWRAWVDIVDVFAGRTDGECSTDRDRVDQGALDPFDRVDDR
jgi:prevent-host-death family protein